DQIILIIEIKGAGTHDSNADIEVITTIHDPIDHNSNDSNGGCKSNIVMSLFTNLEMSHIAILDGVFRQV
ncbi:hypothetical protein, partial [Photobacterium damselae]|uniref:hypothetical protein n=1 Tax=Photobacterium damselae TaxID=38293 RepID=UPI001EFC318B